MIQQIMNYVIISLFLFYRRYDKFILILEGCILDSYSISYRWSFWHNNSGQQLEVIMDENLRAPF